MVKQIKPVFSQTKIFYGMKKVTEIAFLLKNGKFVYTVKDIRELATNQLSKYTGKGYSAIIRILLNESKGQWLNAKQFKVDTMVMIMMMVTMMIIIKLNQISISIYLIKMMTHFN